MPRLLRVQKASQLKALTEFVLNRPVPLQPCNEHAIHYEVVVDNSTAGIIDFYRIYDNTWNIHGSFKKDKISGKQILNATRAAVAQLKKATIVAWVPLENRAVGHLLINAGFTRLGKTKELKFYTLEQD